MSMKNIVKLFGIDQYYKYVEDDTELFDYTGTLFAIVNDVLNLKSFEVSLNYRLTRIPPMITCVGKFDIGQCKSLREIGTVDAMTIQVGTLQLDKIERLLATGEIVVGGVSGVINFASSTSNKVNISFNDGLTKLGYVKGHTVTIKDNKDLVSIDKIKAKASVTLKNLPRLTVLPDFEFYPETMCNLFFDINEDTEELPKNLLDAYQSGNCRFITLPKTLRDKYGIHQ